MPQFGLAQTTWTGTHIPGVQPSGLSTIGDHSDVTGRIAPNAVGAARLLADCIVRSDPAAAHAFMASSDPKSKSMNRVLSTMQDCMSPSSGKPAKVTFKARSLRGVIAESLLKQKPPVAPNAVELADVTYPESWLSNDPEDRVVQVMAICVVATQPQPSIELLKTAPDSVIEKTAFASLAPSLGPCLSANAKLSANRTFIRWALAEAMYHRVYDAWGLSAPTQVAGKK